MKKQNLAKLFAFLLIAVLLFSQGAVFAENYATRDDIPEEYKWKLETIYKSIDAFNADYDEVLKDILPKIEAYKGKLKSSKAILEVLKLDDQMLMKYYKMNMYAKMRLDINQLDSEAAELSSRVGYLLVKAGAAEAFIEPEILSKSDRALDMYINSSLLKDYKFYLQKLKDKKAHVLSASEEEILAKLGDFAKSPEEIYDKLTLADAHYPYIIDYETGEVEFYNPALMRSEDPEERKRGYEILYSSTADMQYGLSQTLISEVKKNVFFATVRKYESALQASMSSVHVPTQVYDNLIDTLNNNLDSLHKYMELRAKAIGFEKIHSYDMALPMLPSYRMTIPYEEGKAMVKEALKPLGEEYISMLDYAFNNNWIDVYPSPNKYAGGYSWGQYDTDPIILMNYTDDLNSVSTLAHELGHSMHTWYAKNNNNYRNYDYAIFNAEVASTLNELLLSKYLINKAETNIEKIYLLNTMINNMRNTVFIQAMYAEFEKSIHEAIETGAGLSADSMKYIWLEILQKYYGDNYVPEDFIALWPLEIPHFFMNFYVYNYATSFIAACPISDTIYNGEEGAVENYLKYLKAGGSDYPVEILKKAGVDMTKPEPIEAFTDLFDSYVKQLEQLMIEEGLIAN